MSSPVVLSVFYKFWDLGGGGAQEGRHTGRMLTVCTAWRIDYALVEMGAKEDNIRLLFSNCDLGIRNI